MLRSLGLKGGCYSLRLTPNELHKQEDRAQPKQDNCIGFCLVMKPLLWMTALVKHKFPWDKHNNTT